MPPPRPFGAARKRVPSKRPGRARVVAAGYRGESRRPDPSRSVPPRENQPRKSHRPVRIAARRAIDSGGRETISAADVLEGPGRNFSTGQGDPELAQGRVPALARHCHTAAVACLPAARLDEFRRQLRGHRVDWRRGEPASLRLANRGAAARRPTSRSPCDVPRHWADCSGESMPQAQPIAISRPPICSWSKRTCDVHAYLVDLDGLQPGGLVSFQRRARDLARLAAGLAAHPWVTRSICRRFLRAYVEESPKGCIDCCIDWKVLWRAIARETQRIVRRKQNRGERVL